MKTVERKIGQNAKTKLVEFVAALKNTFPSISLDGLVSRGQIMEMIQNEYKVPNVFWQCCRNPEEAPNVRIYDLNVFAEELSGINMNLEIPKFEKSLVTEAVKEALEEDTTELTPDIDDSYIPFGAYSTIDTLIASGIFCPANITGESGNGKSKTVEQVCAKNKRELIRINITKWSDEDNLIGTKTLVDGNVEIVEGPVVIAMRRGAILLLDEFDAGNANNMMCLQSILEGGQYYFKLKNEIIKPAPGFNIITTSNTKGKGSDSGRYVGTQVLNEAFLDRIGITIEQPYPTVDIEEKILVNHLRATGIKASVIEKLQTTGKIKNLCVWADSIRKSFDQGSIDEQITTRRLIHIVKNYAIFGNMNTVVKLCCARFDEHTKRAFQDLYDAIDGGKDIPAAI